MKRKFSQKLTRPSRQISRHGDREIVLTMSNGREYWRGTVSQLHGSPIVCGIPEPLLMSPTSTDPAIVVQGDFRKSAM